MIPEAKLALMTQQTNPPRPIGFDVIVEGRTLAVLSIEEVIRAFTVLKKLDTNNEKC